VGLEKTLGERITVDRRLKLLQGIEKAWSDFRESYAGLSEADALKPGVIGRWSVKDIIAHVTTWEEETLKHLPDMIRGERHQRYSVQYGGIDAFNALMTDRKKGFSLSEALRQQNEVHGKLVQYIESVPEEFLGSGTRFRHRLRMDTYNHYSKHATAIRLWKLRITNDE
jgi:hypothetical protein